MSKGLTRHVATVGTAATAATALAGAIIASLPVLGMAVGFGATTAVYTYAARKLEKAQHEHGGQLSPRRMNQSSDAILH